MSQTPSSKKLKLGDDFPPLKNDLILKAAKGEKTWRTPVWIMRQAGRYLPEFKELRSKSGMTFFEVCRTPEHVTELTLQPLRRFDLDAAIIFSDILVVPQCMGLEIEMKPGKGPVFPRPLDSPVEIDTRLKIPDVKKELNYVYEGIRMTRHKLEGKVPLIGFSGAPWTLMAYMVEGEGSKSWSKAKSWLFRHPKDSHKLLAKITDVIVEYLKGQVEAGAQLLQVFDSWAGELSPKDFDEFCLPYLQEIAEKVKKVYPEIPMIVFAKGANASFTQLAKSKYNVVGCSWTISPSEARRLTDVGKTVCLQGNMDPCVLYGDKEEIEKRVERMLEEFGTQNYIANLGHGLHPEHDPEHVKWFIDAVHDISVKMNGKK